MIKIFIYTILAITAPIWLPIALIILISKEGAKNATKSDK